MPMDGWVTIRSNQTQYIDIPVGTVWTRLRLGLGKLRDCFDTTLEAPPLELARPPACTQLEPTGLPYN